MKNKLGAYPLLCLLTAALLAGCFGDSVDQLLSSAKVSMDRGDRRAAMIYVKSALQKNQNSADARFLLAKILLESGDAAGAAIEISKAADLKFPADQTVPISAKILVAKGEWEKIIRQYGSLKLTDKSAQADLSASLAVAHFSLGHLKEARAALDFANQVDPSNVLAKLLNIRMLAAQNELAEASAAMDALLAAQPKRSDVWQLSGELLALKNQPRDALAALQKAIQLDPTNLQAHQQALNVLLKDGDAGQAGEQWELLRKQLPNHPQTLYYGVVTAYSDHKYQLAADRLPALLKAAGDDGRVLYLAGAVQFQLGGLPLAESYLNKAVVTDFAKGSPGVRLLLARTYVRMGNASRALATLQPLMELAATTPGVYSVAAEAALIDGDVHKAESFFAQAAAMDPGDVRSRTMLAVAKIREGREVEGIADLRAISAEDGGSTADSALISTYISKKNFDGALSAISALEKKRPADPEPLVLRAHVENMLGHKDGARAAFEKALAMSPRYFAAARGLADLDVQAKQPQDAIARFEKMIAADPQNTNARLAVVGLKAQMGATKAETVEALKAAIRAAPSDAGPRLALIKVLTEARDAKQAVAAAQEAAAAIPNRADILIALAESYFAVRDFNQAASAYRSIAALQPSSPYPYLRMAEAHAANSDPQAAVVSLKKALSIKPDYFDAQAALLSLEMGANRLDEARSLLKQVQAQHPNQANTLALTGDFEAATKNWPAAARSYRQAFDLQPSTPLAMKLYRVLDTLNMEAEKAKLADQWLKKYPADVTFMAYVGDVALRRADEKAALEWYGKVVKVQPENYVMLNNIAWLLAKAKKPDALSYALKANKIKPDSPELMDTLAGIYADDGNLPKAIEIELKSLEIDPAFHSNRLNVAKMLLKAGDKAAARVHLRKLLALGPSFGQQAEVERLLAGL
ncbi:XrtA/PEP-CTERM system TPR-repeat protein PrsT [Roseateles sp. BYS96W]|uniref:XrtA/PEP-CTERM system TPR-repeat protein PrsT n=1 Tax=Pelomonas nitida TaxID=3299027 RepID=A0ABW7G178_9BURK